MKAAISLFAPASVANISCGYDVLGLCLESVGDTMHLEKTAVEKWCSIKLMVPISP